MIIRKLFSLALAVALALCALQASALAHDSDDPVIVKAQANSVNTQLTIEGKNFGTKVPVVTLGGVRHDRDLLRHRDQIERWHCALVS